MNTPIIENLDGNSRIFHLHKKVQSMRLVLYIYFGLDKIFSPSWQCTMILENQYQTLNRYLLTVSLNLIPIKRNISLSNQICFSSSSNFDPRTSPLRFSWPRTVLGSRRTPTSRQLLFSWDRASGTSSSVEEWIHSLWIHQWSIKVNQQVVLYQ